MNYSLIYFSPHLDDVVLSCGGVLKKNQKNPQLIVNVFSGQYKGLTNWDLSCGIKTEDPISLRKNEDKKALHLIKAASVHLNFLDNAFLNDLKNQKRIQSDFIKIKKEVFKILKENISLEKAFFPLGISHPDHFLLVKIGKEIAKELKEIRKAIYFYEDFPYFYKNFKLKIPYFLKEFTPIYFRIDKEIFTKIKMIFSYKSQLSSLLKILYPQLKISKKSQNFIKEKWKEFLLKYHQGLAKESKIKNAIYCERFWILKN